jgi:hypothetical protein
VLLEQVEFEVHEFIGLPTHAKMIVHLILSRLDKHSKVFINTLFFDNSHLLPENVEFFFVLNVQPFNNQLKQFSPVC